MPALFDEVNNDPLARGYAAMSDVEVADDINTAYRTRPLSTMAAHEVINEIDKSEWDALTGAQKDVVWNLLSMGTLNPFGIEASIFIDVFGGGSTTISNLASARVVSITRAQELGIPAPEPVDISVVRT